MKFSTIILFAVTLIRVADGISSSEMEKVATMLGAFRLTVQAEAGGGIKKCKYAGRFDQGEHLDPGEFIERGEGICDGPWTFSLTEGKGKLQLLRDDDVMWTAGAEGIGFCRMNRGGVFACYDGSPGNRGDVIWALNCGGPRGSERVYMYLDGDDGDVLNMLNSRKGWWLESEDGEVDGDNYDECGDGACKCKPKTNL